MTAASSISDLFAWQVLDSRGRPTVACEIRLVSGTRGHAAVPSGASTGTHEAHELRDGAEAYAGAGVLDAVRHVNTEIKDALVGIDVADQQLIDGIMRRLDGTPNLGRLGANAVLAVSVAAALTAAVDRGVPLYVHLLDGAEALIPLPMVNIISGGAHAGGAVDIQDFLAIPVGASSFAEAIDWTWRVRAATSELFVAAGYSQALVADEGGLAATLGSNESALDYLTRGIERSGLRPGDDIAIAVDVAATQFHKSASATYHLASEGRELTAAELGEELADWTRRFPIISIEDAFAEDDWDSWAAFHALHPLPQLLGDDLFVTNSSRLKRGIAERSANAVLVKPNQIGTLTAAREVVDLARASGFNTVLSARSGETEDTWLSDLAVGWRTGQIKVGSTTRSERTAKWNRLLRIEAELGTDARLASPFAEKVAP